MHRAALSLPSSLTDTHAQLLGDAYSSLDPAAFICAREDTHRGRWTVEWIFETLPPLEDLHTRLIEHAAFHDISLPVLHCTDWRIEAIDRGTDWLAESYRGFPAFSVGPFFIHGAHYTDATPADQIPLLIDAATAFGSGEHATTQACLQAMLDMKGAGNCPWNVLDMGCGSGILAIAAWKLWKTPILAVDIDAEAIRMTEHHAAKNGVNLASSALTTQAGDGFDASLVSDKAPFDLIIANILAGPLQVMAGALADVADTGGHVILSGMLDTQAQGVLSTYTALGFTLKRRYEREGWATLLLRKP